MSKGWHYQLMRHKDGYGGTYLAIHEFYSTEILGEGEGAGWTLDPCNVTGEDIKDVVWSLKAMLHDIEKHGVKDYE